MRKGTNPRLWPYVHGMLSAANVALRYESVVVAHTVEVAEAIAERWGFGTGEFDRALGAYVKRFRCLE